MRKKLMCRETEKRYFIAHLMVNYFILSLSVLHMSRSRSDASDVITWTLTYREETPVTCV